MYFTCFIGLLVEGVFRLGCLAGGHDLFLNFWLVMKLGQLRREVILFAWLLVVVECSGERLYRLDVEVVGVVQHLHHEVRSKLYSVDKSRAGRAVCDSLALM